MKYTPQKIFEHYDKWHDYYNENNLRGFECEQFAFGEQWDSDIEAVKEANDEDILTFNECQRLLKQVCSEVCSFDYSLEVKEKVQKDTLQIKMAKKIMDKMLLSDEYKKSFAGGMVKALTFGYAVFVLDTKYENDYSMQMIPKFTFAKNPEFCFFDKNATADYKEDSAFCGIKKKIAASTLKKHYKQFKDVHDEEKIEVIDFWYKAETLVEFVQLESGRYRRKDKLIGDEVLSDQVQSRYVEAIYFMRVTESEILEKPSLHLNNEENNYISNNLPLVFFGMPYRFPDKDQNIQEKTTPFIFPLLDVQRLYNQAASEVSTLIRHQNSRQYFFTAGQISGASDGAYRNINMTSGAIEVNEPDQTKNTVPFPQVVDPAPFNADMLNVMVMAKKMMNELAGVNLSQQGSPEDKAVSGAAVEARILQGNVIHKSLVNYFKAGINYVGSILKDMMPAIITNEYELLIDGQLVVLNKQNRSVKESPEIEHSIQSLNEDFDFTIESSAFSHIEHDKQLHALMQLSINKPNLDPMIMDVIIGELQLKESSKLKRRFEAVMPQDLYQIGEGIISREQYVKQKEIEKQQAAQQQPEDPLVMDVKIRAQEAAQKAQMKQQELITKQKLELAKLEQEKAEQKAKLEIEQEKIQLQKQKLELDAIKAQLTSQTKEAK